MQRWEEEILAVQKIKAETLISFLEEKGDLSLELKEQIYKQLDLKIIDRWVKLAAKCSTISEFEQNM